MTGFEVFFCLCAKVIVTIVIFLSAYHVIIRFLCKCIIHLSLNQTFKPCVGMVM